MSDCIGPTNIIPNNNEVVLQDVNRIITVIDNNCCTTVTVTQPIVETIQVNVLGPQGPIGAQGPQGLSVPFNNIGNDIYATTSSIEITGSLDITGSLTVNTINVGQNTINFIDENKTVITSLLVSGSDLVLSTGSILINNGGLTGSLFGTSSWADSASQALTASYALNAGSTINTGSLITTSSFNSFTSSYYIDSASFNSRINNITFDSSSLVTTSSFNTFTSSIQNQVTSLTNTTSSYVLNSQTGSFTTTSSFNTFTSSIQNQVTSLTNATSSYVLNSVTSSFVTTSSFNSFTSSYQNDSSSFDTRINSLTNATGSYILNSQTASFVQNDQTSSFVQNSQTGSFRTGSFTGSFTGSLFGTSSWASSASQALTASFVNGAIFTTSNRAANATIANTVNTTLSSATNLTAYPIVSLTTAGAASSLRNYGSLTGSLKFIINENNTDIVATGSISATNILSLTPQHPLPSGVPTGSFAVSASVPPRPFFWNGSSWNALY